MSDYIFNCFIGRVTTGLACSLSVDATEGLTERRGRRVCFVPHVNSIIKVHVHFKMENDLEFDEPETDQVVLALRYQSPAVSSTYSIHALMFTSVPSMETKESLSGLFEFTLLDRSLLHRHCMNVSPSNRVRVHKDTVRSKTTVVLLQGKQAP